VDDLDDNRTLLRLDLEDELPGILVDEARNGTEALQKLKSTNYTLVLCDLMMPDIDGFEVYRETKKMDKNNNLPFIFISANQDQNMAVKGLELGAIDFLKKPYDVSELIFKSRNLCRLKIFSDRQEALLEKLEETNRNLEEINAQKDEVLRIVSHDMRNPLGNMIGLAQILQEDPKQEPEDIQNIAEVMIRSGENLLAIVNTLLDAARIEAGKMDLELREVFLNDLVREEVDQFEYAARQKSISLTYHCKTASCKAQIDEPKIRQSVANLISNALKFTRENGRVWLELSENETHFLLSICDDGIGIEKEKIPFVFEKFSAYQRVGTKNERGTGLGLSIVKAFIQLHGGEVHVDSTPGTGTCFIVSLPKR
jgi:signal transduction histidine kinase